MTRFARAKGSKASNEKVREEATPWNIMRKQLEESLNKEKSSEGKGKTKTARQLLEEKEKPAPSTNDWAEFDNPKTNQKSQVPSSSKIKKPTEKKIKKKKLKESLQKQAENNTDLLQDVSEKVKTNTAVKDENHISEKSKKKANSSKIQSDSSSLKKKKRNKIDVPEATDDTVPKQKKKKIEISEKSEENSSVIEESKTKPTEKLSKRQKRNLKKKNQNSEAAKTKSKKSVFDTDENDWNTDVKFGISNTKLDKEPGPSNSEENNSKNDFQPRNSSNQNRFGGFERQRPNMKSHHLRKPKMRDDKEHNRRKPMQSTKLMINGMEIEVMMYDGFPVQKEDAERLKELKQQMILKGIPKSEIDAAMKLERRKAEKALARVRKQVCFHCRKPGHNLADCPELGKEECVTGICFKCGSTEHTHFECKVTKSDDYRYAKCFICREQGHLAKQCPDNPKGLYPKGGACKICGDVTHLKKDCPDAAREKEATTITVKTISDSALESIEEEGSKVEQKKKPKKIIVKF